MATKKHVIGSAIVSLDPYYSGTTASGSQVSDITGVSLLDGDPPADAVSSTIRAQVLGGAARRFKVRVTGNKIRTMYCAAANASKISTLVGAEIATGLTIISAWFPQHYNYGA